MIRVVVLLVLLHEREEEQSIATRRPRHLSGSIVPS